jgi:hypothetical protein
MCVNVSQNGCFLYLNFNSLLKGKTSVVRVTAKKSSIKMISSITNQDKVRFMLYQETMTSQILIKF